MLKIVSLFLIFIAVLAMFGKLRWIGISRDKLPKGLPKPKLCPECGRYNLRGGPCRQCTNGQD
ncbi:MAG: hypothetical protein AAF376_01605 [Pseudomonadota bacterium]